MFVENISQQISMRVIIVYETEHKQTNKQTNKRISLIQQFGRFSVVKCIFRF